MFTASSNGTVNKYAVLGQIENHLMNLYDETLKAFSSKNEFYYGYIANEKADKKSKGENLQIIAGGNTAKDLTVGSSANKYTYDDANSRKIEIVEGDFLGTNNTDYFDVDKDGVRTATMVLIRVVEDDVVDIYSFNERVTINSDKTVKGVKTKYVKGKDANVTEFNVTPVVKEEVAAPAEDAVVTEKDAETVEID